MFLRNIKVFFENIKVFFAAWECVKTKPCYPIVSCRGEVHSPENSLLLCLRAGEPCPYERNDSIIHVLTHPPVCKVCTYASDYTYGGIRPHVYTHQVTRIYVSSYTYVRMSLHIYMS